LVKLDRRNFPIGFGESRRVSAYVGLTAGSSIAGIAQWTSRGAKDSASPVTTEINVEDNRLALESAIKVAGALEVGHRGTKSAGIRGARGNRTGNTTTLEEPDFDVLGRPFHGIHAATCSIEGISIAPFGSFDLAASRRISF